MVEVDNFTHCGKYTIKELLRVISAQKRNRNLGKMREWKGAEACRKQRDLA